MLGRIVLDFAVKKKKLKDHTMGLLLMALCSLFAQENWAESTGFDEDGLWLTEQPEFLPVDDAFSLVLKQEATGIIPCCFKSRRDTTYTKISLTHGHFVMASAREWSYCSLRG